MKLKALPCPLLIILCSQMKSGMNNNSRFPLSHTSAWGVDHIINGASDENKHIKGNEIFKNFINGGTVIGSRSYIQVCKSGVVFFNKGVYLLKVNKKNSSSTQRIIVKYKQNRVDQDSLNKMLP
jgi:hypothetical protein